MGFRPDADLVSDGAKPTTDEVRHRSAMSTASLPVGMVVRVPTYMLAASMIKKGMRSVSVPVRLRPGRRGRLPGVVGPERPGLH